MAKIVYVEDEVEIRASIVDELVDAGHDVIQAANGRAGLAAVLQHDPDLVISDWLMPEMSGFELFQALRCDHPKYAAIPFIFVSAHADRHYVETGLKLGADAYLTKPVDFDALLEAVDFLIGDGSGSKSHGA